MNLGKASSKSIWLCSCYLFIV